MQSSFSSPKKHSLAPVSWKDNFSSAHSPLISSKLKNNRIIPKITDKRNISRTLGGGGINYIKSILCPKTSLIEKTLEPHGVTCLSQEVPGRWATLQPQKRGPEGGAIEHIGCNG